MRDLDVTVYHPSLLFDILLILILMWSRTAKITLVIFIYSLVACSEQPTAQIEKNQAEHTNSELSDEELNYTPPANSKVIDEFETIEWEALIPKDVLEALLTPPDYINDIADGSLEDNLERQIEDAFEQPDDPYQQALVSTKVIPEMDGKRVRIPGFIVPIETNEDKLVTEFFIVPYFGACLHMPPPPPNQIIYATYPQGVEQPTLFEPFWLSGELKTETTTNDIAQAAYEMRVVHYQLYEE